MPRILIDLKISSRVRHGLIGLDRQFDRPFFELRTIRLRCLFTPGTDLTRSLISLVSRCPVKYSHIRIVVGPLDPNLSDWEECTEEIPPTGPLQMVIDRYRDFSHLTKEDVPTFPTRGLRIVA